MSTENPGVRRGAVVRVAVLLAALAASVGCVTGPPEHDAAVLLTLDSESYKLGQPVQATVSVTNNGQVDLLVPALDNSGLKFRWGRPGAGQPLVRQPVLPEKAAGEPRVVAPGKSTSRTLLFTGLTGEPGEWGLAVGLYGCRSAGAEAWPLPAYYAEIAAFTVSDETMFERDPASGIIIRRQAIALARERGGVDETVPARAVLVPLYETGLYVWAVWLGAEDDPPDASPDFTVSPYSGIVRPRTDGEPSQERAKE